MSGFRETTLAIAAEAAESLAAKFVAPWGMSENRSHRGGKADPEQIALLGRVCGA
jgi:hypothetical protein